MIMSSEVARSIGHMSAVVDLTASTIRWAVRDLPLPVWIATDLRELGEELSAAHAGLHADLNPQTTGALSFAAGRASTKLVSLANVLPQDGERMEYARKSLTDAGLHLGEVRNAYLERMGF